MNPRLKLREEAFLFVGSLFSEERIFREVENRLAEEFGPICMKSPATPWNHSDYYNKEFNEPIFRSFHFWGSIIDPTFLVDAKLITQRIERDFSLQGKRQINLDPGYLSLAKVVLASRKNYSHRIYLGEGIFAELELYFKDGCFNPLFYTYSDYRNAGALRFFSKARTLLKKTIKESTDAVSVNI